MEFDDDGFPLSDAQDIAILMHRDAHFGGQFDLMLDYYQKEGKGVLPDFDLDRILELKKMEEVLGQNLAAVMLSGAEAEHVARSKEAYKTLREIYETSKKQSDRSLAAQYPQLIADLILSEEEYPEKEIEAITAEGKAIVPHLLNLVRAEDFHDPLFPGYGQAPMLAAKCLGLIGDQRAVISLFESIGEEEFANEDVYLRALQEIGTPAKEFLLKVVHGKPVTYDNERAAVALLQFKDDSEVAKKCFAILKDLDLKKHPVLGTYLVLACQGLKDEDERKAFMALCDHAPSSLKPDFRTVSSEWKKN